MSEPLDPNRIGELLTTRFVGHPLIVLDSVDSTNRYLLTKMQSGEAGPGTVVLAESQTEGAGRQGRVWHSRRSLGLCFSVLLEAEEKQLLSLLAGVAVVLSIRSFSGLTLSLRWPNDVYAGSRKLAGILCQTGAKSRAVVVGVGLNVNQETDDFDASLRNRATSLRILKRELADREKLLAVLLKEIEDQYTGLQTGGRETMLMQYVRFSDFLERPVRLRLSNRIVTGKAVGFHAKGDILIETPNGRRERYTEGEIIEVMDAARD